MVAEATWAKALGEHVRTRRQAAGKGREDLAAAVGSDTAWIDLVEEGALPALPEPERFQRLARALGSEPGELLEVAGYLPAERGKQPSQRLLTLDLSADRVSRLQEVIASFSESLTPKQVADVVLQQAIDALRADAGSVVLTTRDGLELEMVSSSGFPPWIGERFARYRVDDSLPGAEAMRTGEPIWIDSMEEWRKRYPALVPVQEEIGYSAAAAIPLVVQDRRLGVLGLSFAQPIDFGESERTFALALARQCAQALDRAHLYAAEQAARAEAEIERARLHDLFMKAPARIAVARGPDHIYVFANERYVEYLDDPNILGKPAREVFPGAADQGIVAVADRVYATGEPYVAIETPYRVDFDHDGTEEERYFNVVLQPTYEPDGSVDGVMLFTVDVTEAVRSRHRVEELLAERNAILGQIAEGLVIVDGTRHITFTNETAQALLGTDVTGMDLSTLAATLHFVDREGQPVFESGLGVDRALESAEVTPLDHRIRRPDGTVLIMQGSAAPVTGENGAQLGAVVTFRDVTAQQTLERQKDDFLAAAAHDLKTPLTTIKGIAQILQRRVGRWDRPEAESLLEDLSRIDSTTTRMAILINKLLDLTRLQMDQPLDLDKRPTDIVTLARSMIAEQQLASARHTVRLESDEPELIGIWDAFRLERVISNLLSNAIRYSPEGGEITVSIRRLEEAGRSWAEISVRDQGIGIPARDLPHIFERFFRASNVVGQIAGVGIGLSGVRQIVEQHGGSIAAESQEGIGTTFTVRLPLED